MAGVLVARVVVLASILCLFILCESHICFNLLDIVCFCPDELSIECRSQMVRENVEYSDIFGSLLNSRKQITLYDVEWTKILINQGVIQPRHTVFVDKQLFQVCNYSNL